MNASKKVSIASTYEAGQNRSNIENNIEFLNKFSFSENIKILEIGCGVGNLTKWTFDNISNDIVGIDISDSGIGFARETYPNIQFEKISGDKLTFADDSFDLVISFDLVEHIPNVEEHFKEVHRVLKRNGQYIFATPNKWTNIPWEIAQTQSLDYRLEHPSLMSVFQLKKRLRNNGYTYQIIKMKVVTDFRIALVREKLGELASVIFKYFPFDFLPLSMSTNFFVCATKGEKSE